MVLSLDWIRLALLNKTDFIPGYRFDNSIVYIETYITKFEKSQGFWNFNDSLIQDLSYVNLGKRNIEKVILS